MAIQIQSKMIDHFITRDNMVVKEASKKWLNIPDHMLKKITMHRRTEEAPGTINLPFHVVFKKTKCKFVNEKNYTRITPWQLQQFELRDYQKEVVQEALRDLKNQHSAILQVFCGFGKTHTSLYLAQKLTEWFKLKTLIILPDNKAICQGWYSVLKDCTTLSPDEFYVQGISQQKITGKTAIIVVMKNALWKFPEYVIKTFGTVLIDEAHLFCTELAIQQLLRLTPVFIIMLTATFERGDGMHRALELIAGNKRIIKKDPKKFLVFKIKTPFVPKDYKTTARGKVWADVIKKLDEMPEREDFIVDLVKANSDLKILILTKHVTRAKQLTERLNKENLKSSFLAGRKDDYEDTGILIATFSKVGVGFDEKNACASWNGQRLELLILDSPVKNIEQYLGRVARSNYPSIIYPVDKLSNCNNHFNACAKWWRDPARNAEEREIKFGDTVKVSDYM